MQTENKQRKKSNIIEEISNLIIAMASKDVTGASNTTEKLWAEFDRLYTAGKIDDTGLCKLVGLMARIADVSKIL